MSYLPPTRKEAVIVLVSTLSFLLLTAVFIGLRPEHIAMAVVLDVLLFASLYTRKLVVALLPFVVFAVSYDWMRVWPNYMVNDIDVAGLYSAERTIFGIDVDGVRMTLCEFFHEHHCSVPISLPDFSIFVGSLFPCFLPCLFLSKGVGNWRYVSRLFSCWSILSVLPDIIFTRPHRRGTSCSMVSSRYSVRPAM